MTLHNSLIVEVIMFSMNSTTTITTDNGEQIVLAQTATRGIVTIDDMLWAEFDMSEFSKNIENFKHQIQRSARTDTNNNCHFRFSIGSVHFHTKCQMDISAGKLEINHLGHNQTMTINWDNYVLTNVTLSRLY